MPSPTSDPSENTAKCLCWDCDTEINEATDGELCEKCTGSGCGAFVAFCRP